jgi:malonate transporter
VSLIAGVGGAAFVQSVLPVLLIGGLGYLVGRARSLDLAPITGLAVLVLAPAVVFDSLARAALPQRARLGVPGALARVGRQPIIYAVVAGVAVNMSGWSLPGPIAKASQLLGGGAIALMLLLVGLQLARLTVREDAPGAALATVIRLVAVPPMASAIGRLVGLEGMALAVACCRRAHPRR